MIEGLIRLNMLVIYKMKKVCRKSPNTKQYRCKIDRRKSASTDNPACQFTVVL
jgi:hypothetical protein